MPFYLLKAEIVDEFSIEPFLFTMNTILYEKKTRNQSQLCALYPNIRCFALYLAFAAYFYLLQIKKNCFILEKYCVQLSPNFTQCVT